jgi:hypothetical protein
VSLSGKDHRLSACLSLIGCRPTQYEHTKELYELWPEYGYYSQQVICKHVDQEERKCKFAHYLQSKNEGSEDGAEEN